MRGGSLTFSGPPTTIWSRGSIWTSESQSQRFFGPIPSLPQPRINTRVVCCKPTPARTRKLHSTPHQTHRITLSGVWLLSWCLRLLCKNKSPSSLWTALGSLGRVAVYRTQVRLQSTLFFTRFIQIWRVSEPVQDSGRESLLVVEVPETDAVFNSWYHRDVYDLISIQIHVSTGELRSYRLVTSLGKLCLHRHCLCAFYILNITH